MLLKLPAELPSVAPARELTLLFTLEVAVIEKLYGGVNGLLLSTERVLTLPLLVPLPVLPAENILEES